MEQLIKKIPVFLMLLSATLLWKTVPVQASAIDIEIFYLPHRPALNVVDQVEKVAGEFANITIRKYDFEDPDSRRLVEKYQLTQHTPVAVFINGKNRFTVNGHELTLQNFPKGDRFVPMFSGEWDYSDLKTILTELSGAR